MNRVAQPGGWKVANYYTQIQRTRRIAKTPSLGYRIRSYRSSPYFPSLAGHGTPLPVGRAKILGISIILIGLALGGILLYQSPAFHTYACVPTQEEVQRNLPCGDPFTVLWQDRTNSLGGYNSLLATYSGTDGTGQADPSIKLSSNSTHSAVAVSKSPIDFSPTSGKELLMSFTFTTSNGCCTNGQNFAAVYFTTNTTLPIEPAYNPYFDPSVALLIQLRGSGGVGKSIFAFLQKETGVSVSTEDAGCPSTNSCFLAGGETHNPNTEYLNIGLLLNFTGNSNGGGGCNAISGAGNACSNVGATPQTSAADNPGTSQILPWFQFQAVTYHIGFWSRANTGLTVYWAFDNGPQGENDYIANAVSHPLACTASTPCNFNGPSIDPGGFFGPVLRFIISGLTLALGYLMQFLGYVWTAMQIGLDTLGNFLGLGHIGTAITNAFVGVGTWITSVLGSVFSNVGNIATSVGSAISAVGQLTGNFFNGTNGLGAWLTQLGNMAAQFWGIMGTLGLYGKVGVSFLLAAWMLWGAVLAYQDIDKFWNQWYRTTGFGFLWIFKVLWWSGEAGYGIILKIKSLIWPTGSGGGIVQAPA